jgi:hypothetical protein
MVFESIERKNDVPRSQEVELREQVILGRNYTAARHSAVTRIRDVAVDCWVARLGLAR